MKRGKIFIFAVIFLSLVAVLFAKFRTDKKGPEPSGISHSPAAPSGLQEMLASLNIHAFPETNKAPEFELISLEGERFNLSQFRGKAVMLSFWSTW